MSFPFYPKHDYACPHLKCCPHAGGAAIGRLVQLASDHQHGHEQLHRQLDAEKKRNSKLVEENQRLEEKVEQLQLELRLERQNKFAPISKRRKRTSQPRLSQNRKSLANVVRR